MTPRERYNALRQAYLAADAAYGEAVKRREEACKVEEEVMRDANAECNRLFVEADEHKITGPWLLSAEEHVRLNAVGGIVAKVFVVDGNRRGWVYFKPLTNLKGEDPFAACDQALIQRGYTLLNKENEA